MVYTHNMVNLGMEMVDPIPLATGCLLALTSCVFSGELKSLHDSGAGLLDRRKFSGFFSWENIEPGIGFS